MLFCPCERYQPWLLRWTGHGPDMGLELGEVFTFGRDLGERVLIQL
jgi:hypothetical protein